MGSREVWDKYSCASTSQGLLDAVKEFDIADAIEAEESMDQQDRVLSGCIP
jgi:hypothetical protein